MVFGVIKTVNYEKAITFCTINNNIYFAEFDLQRQKSVTGRYGVLIYFMWYIRTVKKILTGNAKSRVVAIILLGKVGTINVRIRILWCVHCAQVAFLIKIKCSASEVSKANQSAVHSICWCDRCNRDVISISGSNKIWRSYGKQSNWNQKINKKGLKQTDFQMKCNNKSANTIWRLSYHHTYNGHDIHTMEFEGLFLNRSEDNGIDKNEMKLTLLIKCPCGYIYYTLLF